MAVPAEATIRRTLARLDADAVARVIGAWLADRQRPAPTLSQRRAVAVDGKTLRGAHTPDGDGRPVHLLAAMDHATRGVLGQRQVAGAPEEVPAFAPLLAPLDLNGVVVTADALQTHAEAAQFLVTHKQAHYLFVVKANQPTLLERCAHLLWHRVPVGDRTRDRGHGRVEIRTLKAISVRHFGFPHAAQVIQVTRKTRDLTSSRWQAGDRVDDHQPAVRAGPPRPPGRPATRPLDHRERPALGPRRHLGRGRLPGPHQCRTHVMAALRNLAIGVLCRAGPVNIATALRRHARDPHRPLAALGISLG